MSAYWYLTRGTGVVALILLTITVALGVANVQRLHTARLPRFVIDAVHRNVALLSVAFVFVHVATTLLDGYVPIRVIDAVVPFTSAYRPFWLGLGALSLDLLAAVVITSLLRRRFGYRAWRATHWAAYASWPVALLHSVGIGSDVKSGWMLIILAACVAVVALAVLWRVTAGERGSSIRPRLRLEELRVQAPGADQTGVVAAFRDPAVVEHDDQLGGAHRREAMRHEQRGRARPARHLAGGEVAIEQRCHGDRVEARRRLVEDQQQRQRAHHPSGERETLPLAG